MAYGQRANLTVTTQDAVDADYSVSITIPHAGWVNAGASRSDGNDVRVVQWSGSAWTELDRVVDPKSSWNSAATKLWFKTQAPLAGSSTNTEYWLYYGNATATTPPADADNVFAVYDDFSSGSIDPARWIPYSDGTSSVSVANGEAVFTGTSNGSNLYNYTGLESQAWLPAGYILDSDFRIVSQSPSAQPYWKGMFGAYSDRIGIYSENNADKRVGWYNGSAWVDEGNSSLDGQTFGAQHMTTAVDQSGGAHLWENGSLRATRWSADTNGTTFGFSYSPNVAGTTYDVRFDNIMGRKYVSNEPSVSFTGLEAAPHDLDMTVTIEPELLFAVAGRAAGTSCNGISSDASTLATAVHLGSPTAISNRTGAQDLHVATNAANGYTVYVQHTGAASSGSNTIAEWGAANSAPTTWAGPGTEALGYTTDAAAVPGGVANRFVSGGAKWAGLSTAASPIAAAPGPADNITCVAYRVGAAATTPAGHYTTSVVMRAVPNF
jgi:hypothetical protein